MAFTIASLKRSGPQNNDAPTNWTYKTADTIATCDTSGYFNSVANRLKVGDRIYVYTTTGPSAADLIVQSNTRDLTASPPVAGVVDTFSGLANVLTGADSD